MSSNSSESDDSYTSDNSDVNFKEDYEFLEAEDTKDCDGEHELSSKRASIRTQTNHLWTTTGFQNMRVKKKKKQRGVKI